jgi:hypothetical protein
MSAGPPPVVLNIRRLVVDGLPLDAAQAAGVRASLRDELARLMRGHPAPDRRPFPLAWDATRPRALGRALAHQVFASLPPVRPPSEDP